MLCLFRERSQSAAFKIQIPLAAFKIPHVVVWKSHAYHTIMSVCPSSVIRLKNGGGVTGKVTNDMLFRALCESSRQIYFEHLFDDPFTCFSSSVRRCATYPLLAIVLPTAEQL